MNDVYINCLKRYQSRTLLREKLRKGVIEKIISFNDIYYNI